MKTEKKLIAYCLAAIMVGVAAVSPLLFLMSGTASAQTEVDKPWFNLGLPYASCQAATDGSTYGFSYTFGEGYTVNSDAVNTQIGGRLEYYRVQMYSDQGQIRNTTIYIGANCTDNIDFNEFNFARGNWFNVSNGVGSTGTFVNNFNGTLSSNILGITGGRIAANASETAAIEQEAVEQVQNVLNAQTIYFDVHRVCCVSFNSNSTVVTLPNDEVIQHIELTKSGNQFVYGTIPEDVHQIPPIPESPA